MKCKIYVALFCLILLVHTTQLSFAQTGWVFGPQSSNKNIEWGFDFVETFDNLQDWQGNNREDVTITKYPDDFPKHADGLQSNWDYYSIVATPSGKNWIAFHGSENVWGGSGKSLCIDLAKTVVDGPSRFGLYFGDGTPESGYDDIYIFHMVKIPKNEWPTHIDSSTGVGTYTAGEPYTWFSSWKFGTINMGMTGPHEFNNELSPYSPFHIIPHIKRYKFAPIFGLALILEPYGIPGGGHSGFWGLGKGIEHLLPGWWGVEFHFKNFTEGAENFTSMDVWIYDESGNSWKALDNTKVQNVSQPFSHKWNFWFFGGNNSRTYTWGPTMESPYYIDDFIINKSRIGPKYFAMKFGYPLIDKVSPDSLIDAASNILIKGLNFGSATDIADATLEITNNADYDNTTVKAVQQITAMTDSTITFNANINGLPVNNGLFYLFFTRKNSVRSPKGFPIFFSSLVTGVGHKSNPRPQSFQLKQNYPNPFNPTTVISYTIAEQSNVFLAVYNVRGQLVRILVNGVVQPGENQVQWNGRDASGQLAPSGIYFYKLKTKSVVLSRKMLFLK